jgi:hypothetical protein
LLQALHLAVPEFFELVPANSLDFPAPSQCFRFGGTAGQFHPSSRGRIFGDLDVGLDRTARYIRLSAGGGGAGLNKRQMSLNWTVAAPLSCARTT